MDILLVDLALAVTLLGLVSLVRPLRSLKIRTRRRALAVLAAGFVTLVIGLSLPVTPPRLPGPPMAIDDVVASYQFGEHHEIAIAAPPERVLAAARAVTAREIRLFRLLTWLRSPRLHARAEQSVLSPAADRPILEVALRTGFVLLHEAEDEVVFGTVVCCGVRRQPRTAAEFTALDGSLARAVMTFHVAEADAGTSRLITQTRVAATDAAAERAFARYWRLIYPGSALIRVMWLRAIRARAEGGG